MSLISRLILAFACLIPCQVHLSVHGQVQLAPSSSGIQPGSPQQQNDELKNVEEMTFDEIVGEIRANEAEINRLYSSIPVGFPNAHRKFMAKIKGIRDRSKLLKSEVKNSAIRSYQKDPNGNPKAAMIVFNEMLAKLEPQSPESSFDPQGALELGNILLDSDLPQDNSAAVNFFGVSYQTFRACFALQDFEKANRLLGQIEKNGTRLLPQIREQLEDAKRKFDREITIRRLESQTDDLPLAKLETSEGVITVELFEDHAPQAVANFINLVERQFYDGLDFFYVRPGEVAQTGCPKGDGTSDAGYQIPCECDKGQIRHHLAGTVSMVNQGKDTGSSQLFFSYQPKSDRDGRYTVFGRIVEGMDVLYRLKRYQPSMSSGSQLEPSKLTRASIVRKRGHVYAPTRLARQSTQVDQASNSDQ
ncbi:MAG: peptidylprolyl isomerase [Planctomycetota bacterium]